MATSVQDALHRFGGMYGSAWRGGEQLSEVIEVTGAVEINRIEVPLVGQTKQGYKPGRESREGTLRIHVVDSKWMLEVWRYLTASLAQRRAARGTQGATLRQFSLKLEVNDPDAYDYEAWTLHGCQVWRMPLGFSITDDIIDRELPLTWEYEEPTHAFIINHDGNGSTAYNPTTALTVVPFPADVA